MLQFDGTRQSASDNPRKVWMELLSRAPLHLLEPAIAPFAGPHPQWLRAPEIGLIMLQGRAGGSGDRFNLGEATVTRCALRPDSAVIACNAVGVAYVMGRSRRHAELAATADALLQDPACKDRIPANFLPQIQAWLQEKNTALHTRAQATKVEFFNLAREAGASDSEQEGEG